MAYYDTKTGKRTAEGIKAGVAKGIAEGGSIASLKKQASQMYSNEGGAAGRFADMTPEQMAAADRAWMSLTPDTLAQQAGLYRGSESSTNTYRTGTEGAGGATSYITPTDMTRKAKEFPEDYTPPKDAAYYSQFLDPEFQMQQDEASASQTEFDKYLQKIQEQEKPNKEAEYLKMEKEAGIARKEKAAQEIANKISSISKQAEANKLSLIGQGRGIPEAIIGGQQAQISREAAIQVLPLQAEYEAAKGDLDTAKERLNKMFEIRSADIDAKYERENKIIDFTYDFATKQQQKYFDYLKEQRGYQKDEQKTLQAQIYDMAGTALENGQTSLYKQLMAMDVSSPNFSRQNFINLSGQIRQKATQGEMETAERQQISALFESSRGDDGYVDPYVYRRLRAESSISPSTFDSLFSSYVNPQSYRIVGFQDEKSTGNYSESTIPTSIKSEIVDDLKTVKKLKLPELIEAYPEVQADFLKKLYDNYNS